jgi:hypothetical protein
MGKSFSIQVGSRMNVCPACGDKRCPRALDHRNECQHQGSIFDLDKLDPDTWQDTVMAEKTTTGIDHPDTSHYAADRIRPRTGTQRARVLEFIQQADEFGATDEEIQDGLGLNPSSQRPRRQELQKAGWIVDSGGRRKTRSGASAIVWTVAPE